MSVQSPMHSRSSPQARSRPDGPQATAAIDPIRIVRQNMTLLITTGFLGLGLGIGVFIVWLVFMPSYTGTATFELIGELSSADDPVANSNRNEDTVQRLAGTEALRAIGDNVLKVVVADGDVQTIAWMDKFKDDAGRVNERDALIELKKEVSAGHQRKTQFFNVRWSARRAEDVPILLTKIRDEYISNLRRARERDQDQATEPFRDQLAEVNDQISTLEDEIATFITDKQLLALDDQATTVQKDLEDRELERNEVASSINQTRALASQIDSKLAGTAEPSQDDVREAEIDPVVLEALRDIQVLRGLVAEHRQKFGSRHPQVVQSQQALDARIREKDRKVEEIILRNLQGQRKTAGDTLGQLESVFDNLDDEITRRSGELTDQIGNIAELKKKNAKLDRLEDRRVEIQRQIDGITSMFLREDAEHVQAVGSVETPLLPSSPKWFVAIPGTAIVLLSSVVGFIFLRELLDKRVRSTSDLTGLPGVRLLGVIPDLKDDPTGVSRPESVVRDQPSSVLAESHRQFAASLRRARQDVNASSCLFVGGMPGAGTTSVVANLASIATSAGRTVSVIDGNLRRPRIADVFGFDPDGPGLGELIDGQMDFESVVQTTQDGIKVVTAGNPRFRTFERLDSIEFRNVVQKAGEVSDVVLIDGPPVIVASEAMGMADQVEATVLVVRAYSEQRGLVARLVRQLREQPSAFLGVLLNRPRYTAGGYFKRNYQAIASYAGDREES